MAQQIYKNAWMGLHIVRATVRAPLSVCFCIVRWVRSFISCRDQSSSDHLENRTATINWVVLGIGVAVRVQLI